jgi:hypothetical protein
MQWPINPALDLNDHFARAKNRALAARHGASWSDIAQQRQVRAAIREVKLIPGRAIGVQPGENVDP